MSEPIKFNIENQIARVTFNRPEQHNVISYDGWLKLIEIVNKIVIENKDSIKNKLSGDAIVTQIKNIAIGILAADCAPVLLYDPQKKNNWLHTLWVEGCL